MNLSTTPSTGRPLATLGILLGFLAPVALMVQFNLQRFFTPYYLPIVGTIAALLVAYSLTRRVTLVRIVALVLLGGLAGLEWWFLSMTAIPAYTGPVAEGKAFPSFTTKLADGTPFTDADLKGDTGTVMVFVRGRWCPICMAELRLLDRRHEEFARRNVKVVAVTLDTDEESLLTKDEFKHLTVVADHDRGLINAAGVLHAKANAKTGEDAAAPTTILIDRAGTVRWLFGSDNAFRRLSPDEVLDAIDRQMPAGK